jgi:hypothetical protein
MKARQPALEQRVDDRADEPAEGDDEQDAGGDFRDLFDLCACDDGVGNIAMKVGRSKGQRRPGQCEQERGAKALQPASISVGGDLRPDTRSPFNAQPGLRLSLGKVSSIWQGGTPE